MAHQRGRALLPAPALACSGHLAVRQTVLPATHGISGALLDLHSAATQGTSVRPCTMPAREGGRASSTHTIP